MKRENCISPLTHDLLKLEARDEQVFSEKLQNLCLSSYTVRVINYGRLGSRDHIATI